MADNYLERRQAEVEAQKASKERAKKQLWQKRLKEYQQKLKKQNSV